MKKLQLFLLVMLICLCAKTQVKMSCCTPSATDRFAMNGNKASFVSFHDDPLPFVYESKTGHDVTFKASDGKDAHGYFVPSERPTNYYLLVIHEWWGLNDYIKQECEKFSTEFGLNVLALDLYENKVATTKEDASKYMQQVNTDRALAIIKGAYTHVGGKAKVFTIGWCFGGGWSLQTAIEGGSQVAGCIMFYGQPETNIDRLKKLNCDVLGLFAKKDEWINQKVVDEFKENMEKAGKKLTVYSYDADHAFANPSNPIYDKDATEDAYKKVDAFVRERMR